jgi:hypothetical protein
VVPLSAVELMRVSVLAVAGLLRIGLTFLPSCVREIAGCVTTPSVRFKRMAALRLARTQRRGRPTPTLMRLRLATVSGLRWVMAWRALTWTIA